jgi:hypothetical protein
MEVNGGPARNPHTRDRRASIKIEFPRERLPASCDSLLHEARDQ